MSLLFVWIFAFTTVLAIVAAMRARSELARGIYLTCFGLAAVLTLTEVAFATYDHLHDPSHDTSIESSGTINDGHYVVPDATLGYAPTPGIRVTLRLAHRDTVIYDVAYTIAANGARATKGNAAGESWVFMGCSFVFGDGLKDDETLPSRFSAALGHRANVVNLGFHGYGPHQMLRILETDRARALVGAPVRQVIYEAISDHPRRAAGHANFDRYGPSYALTSAGVEYDGAFHNRAFGKLLGVAMRSHVLNFVLDRTVFPSTVSDDDIEHYGRIVERSAQLAREKFGAGFTVLYWDDESEVSGRVLARLRATKLPMVLVSEIIPRREMSHLMLPYDGHPSAEANRRLAIGLVERLAR